ncbi:MAG: 4Fe-4S binding protein [Proteobacteria bacterium]|nr:4Fe-4S binding protein [Pseudomonadota bacterium]
MIFLRRLSQGVFLALFFVLFLKTDYNGTDHLDAAVNLLFRLDPFVAACVMLGVKSFLLLLLPSLVVLLLSVIFGRGFCGWFCPMGTLLDLTSKIVSVRNKNNRTYYPSLPLIILVFALFSSLCGFAVAGYIDPFSLLVRGMAQAFYPLLNSLTVGFFSFTYRDLPEIINQVTEPVYSILQDLILPSEQKFFHLAFLSFFMLVGIWLFEGVQRRFFCRNICPLGAMLGLFARRALVAGKGGNSDCGSCRICSSNCRMGAIDEGRKIAMANCNLCFECVQKCPRQIVDFGFSTHWSANTSISLSRRSFIGAAIAGVVLPSVKGVEVLAKNPDPSLIRPPGALAEKEFLARCVRCAECIQVCIGNALQPAFLQAGLDGIFSPVLAARTGYCEFNCTLCGQVCPTGAIRELSQTEKHRAKIGHAWFDKNTCLPYAKGTPCMVCEEHCPTPDKAIRFRDVSVMGDAGRMVSVQQPYIVDELCIGCGICENKCPLPGKAAVYITSAGEDRHPNIFLPSATATPYSG